MTDPNEKRVSYLPTDGLSYDPIEGTYWDPDALQKEITRAFELCYGCRMCFKYCDAFPILFRYMDEELGGDVRRITDEQIAKVMDACFQCKLCEVQCPYTPRDAHEFQLDFPKLVHRYKAVRARRRGILAREKFFADPDGAARLARLSFGLANLFNKFSPVRWFMEKILGIHRRKLLPDFASSTFEKWAAANGKMSSRPGGEAVLFQTCFVQNNDPQIGRDVLEVLEKNGVDARCVPGLACCGMPAWEHGDLETLRRNAKTNIDALLPYVEAGAKVLVVNPTCSMMLRREYPHLVPEEDRERAKKLAAAVMDPGEYLWSIRNEERFKTDFRSSPGKVAYHAPCHLRAQAVGFKGRDLIRKIPGTQIATVMECCGHNGTFAMTKEGFEPSARIGKKAFDGMKETEAEVWATECPLAAIQFQQHTGTKAIHPMTVLARAYRENGFPNPAAKE